MSSSSISSEVPRGNTGDHAHTVVNIDQGRNEVVEDYDAMLWEAKRSARTSALFHKLTHFMGICAITWSMVVLLGGFASSLPWFDFYIVVILLVLDVGRFSCALFFTQLVRKNLVHNSQDPQHLNYKDIHREIVSLLRFLFALGQIVFLLPALGLPLWRFLVSPSGFADLKESNLIISMHLFYPLVLCNAMLVVAATLVSTYHHSRFFSTSNYRSGGFIQQYFDEVMWRALHLSLVEADDFDVFKFAFKMQARDYRCNVQPFVVEKVYGGFFKYLLAHRIGLHILSNYLESNDCFEQRVAANVLGFWCKINNNHLKKSLSFLSTTFLQNLLRKMETRGQIGWDAANSLALLAHTFKELSPKDGTSYMVKLTELTTSDQKNVVEFLTSKLDPEDSWSISYLRLLTALLHNIDDQKNPVKLKKDPQVDNVKRILESDKSTSRTKMYAAYVLLKAKEDLDPGSVDGILAKEKKDTYFLVDEVYMLNHIFCYKKKSLEAEDLQAFEIRGKVRTQFYFKNETDENLSTSIVSLWNKNDQTSKDSATSSQMGGILTKLCYRVSLAFKCLWVGGVHDPKETKNA